MKSDTGLISRRKFLGKAGCLAGSAIGFPYIVSSTVFGESSPSNRINIGCIGVGRMGLDDMRDMFRFGDVRVAAVCDVDSKRARYAQQLVEKNYSEDKSSGRFKGCKVYGNFRELIGREDIDAVMIATPDHWHAIPSIEAAKAGKDIFLQKPLTYTIEEGRVLSDTVKKYGNIFMVGSQQRSDARFRFACELVRNGRIGKLKRVKVGFGVDHTTGVEPVMAVPLNLDYEMWLGPAPYEPYTEKRVHPQNDYSRPGWLRVSDYCLGMITGWGSHHMDIAQWGMGVEHSGPTEIDGWGKFAKEGLWDVHIDFRIEYKYANGVTVNCSGNNVNKQGVFFEGSDGWVYVRRGYIDAEPKSILRERIKAGEIHLYKSDDHKANFIECIKSRKETVSPVEIGHRSCTSCILGYISMRLGRKIRWDAANEKIINDGEAGRLLRRPMRSPWRL